MKLYVFGLNYQIANLDLRQKMAFTNEQISFALANINNKNLAKEVIILSTCNRTEIYFIAEAIEPLINFICELQGICFRRLVDYSYILENDECARHLFKVACGLESMVLGETEIVCQIKNAAQLAKNSQTLGKYLNALVQMSLAASKEVRTNTSINKASTSMGRALMLMLKNKIMIDDPILLVGAGQMMQKIAPYVAQLSTNIGVINRSIYNANLLAHRINAKAYSLEEIREVINNYKVIIACCNSNKPFINSSLFSSFASKLIIDLSVPLVIDQDLFGKVETLVVDEIAKLVDVGASQRNSALQAASMIIEEKITSYNNWLRKQGIAPMVRSLRDYAEKARQQSLENALKQLENNQDIRAILEQLSRQLTNKLMHIPTINLYAQTGTKQSELTKFLGNLYGINTNETKYN